MRVKSKTGEDSAKTAAQRGATAVTLQDYAVREVKPQKSESLQKILMGRALVELGKER
jgi:hypothetical protein